MRSFLKSLRYEGLVSLGAGLALGAALAAGSGQGSFVVGWLGTSLLLILSFWGLLAAWRLAGSGKALAWITLLAFVLRLGVGLFMTWGLSHLTNTTDYITQAGYFFRDAYARDHEAWAVAQSGQFFTSTFKTDFMADQYGGMLVLSALVYRGLSPDAHRTSLILILTAAAGGIGVPIFWAAVRRKWGTAVALPAACVLAFYPEGVLLGSTQMRESFVIALTAVMLWGAVTWPVCKRSALVAFGVGLVGLILLSPPIALAVAGIILGWVFIQEMGRVKGAVWPMWGWMVITGGAVVMVGALGEWLLKSSQWDLSQTLAGSERLQGLLARFPQMVKTLFIVVYGLTQPVLPAAAVVIVGKDTPMIIKIANFMASLGWYLMVPFLIYILFVTWQTKDLIEKRGLIWLTGAAYLWIIVASVRGGGDQWDNPRYRTILLILLAVLAGLGWNWARIHRDAWLGRWLAVEGVFLFFFTGWYMKRYTPIGFKLPFWDMIAAIVGLSVLILVGGWAWDRYYGRPRPAKPTLTQPPESL